ncbi:unnamed protein product [Phyllotreta striolata]|uniref:Sperm flagellar protein 2 n=1 Tax=Phyllotreta striolata TaxID=444603 RepID=A0A9N9XPK5_PHYSR|nr:unnamed protein product [Phyllotreta striolata]
MSDIIKRWIQEKLGIIINLRPETFCQLSRDGSLLCRILRNYEIINDDQLKMIRKSNVRSVCLVNFKEHIMYWLDMLNIQLTAEEIIDIVDCNGLASLTLFYRVFIELHEKDCLTFILKNRLSEKLRPQLSKYAVHKVKDKLPENLVSEKYIDHLDNTADVKHWLQDRLEVVLSKCKTAREEYWSIIRSTERNSAHFSRGFLPSFEEHQDIVPNTSARSVDMTYKDLVIEKSKAKNAKPFLPDSREAQKIVQNIKNKLANRAESTEMIKELQRQILETYFSKLVDEENENVTTDLTEKIMKQSLYEKQMLSKIREVQYQRENMLESKKALNQSIIKEKERELVNKMLNKNKEMNKLEHEYYMEKRRLYQLHQEIYQKKLKIKAEKMHKLCQDSIYGICTMALRFLEHKRTFGEEPPQKVVDMWKKLIYAQDEEPKVPAEDLITLSPAVTETVLQSEMDRQIIFDRRDLDDYTNFEYPWILRDLSEELVNDMNNGTNILGYIIHSLLNMKYPRANYTNPPDLPNVNIRACLKGVPQQQSLKTLQKLLIHRNVLVVELQDTINYCLDVYKAESKHQTEESSDDETAFVEIEEKPPMAKKGAKKKSKFDTITSESEEQKDKAEKVVQTPKIFPDEIVELSNAGSLGKIISEELSAGNCLTDFLMVSTFIEYLKNKENEINGWVLVNYPNTYEQAILFEETLTGCQVPGVKEEQKINKSLVDIVSDINELKDPDEEKRFSSLVPDPRHKEFPMAYDTVLTAFINVKSVSDDSCSSYDFPQDLRYLEDTNDLERFYTDQGCHYAVYYQDFDFFTIKHVAKLVIGEFTLPAKPSVELFGETITYLEAGKGEDKKTTTATKMGEKKELDRIEKVVVNTSRVTSLQSGVESSTKKQKAALMVVKNDKSTQIPETVLVMVEPKEPPKPGEDGFFYEKLTINNDIGSLLVDMWERMEEIYINDLSQVFFEKRVIMNTLRPYVSYVQHMIRSYIVQTDNRHLIMREFQDKFNQFDSDYRKDKEFKAQMQCLTFSFTDRLSDLADVRVMRAERQRHDVILVSWGVKQMIQLVNNFITGFQIELDRSCDSMTFIIDYFCGIITNLPGDEIIAKEILPKFPLDSAEIENEINNIYINVGVPDANPLVGKIDAVYRKALAIVDKNDSYVFSKYEAMKFTFMSGTGQKSAKSKSTMKATAAGTTGDNIVAQQQILYLFDIWYNCLKGETARIKIRLHLLKRYLLKNVESFFVTLKDTYHSLYKENQFRYDTELKTIKDIWYMFMIAIEKEQQIQHELVFINDHLYVRPSVILFEDPVEEPPKLSNTMVFSVRQLNALIELFIDLGPDGFVPARSFSFILQDMTVNNTTNWIPDEWTNLTGPNVFQFTQDMFGPQEFVCWKDFIIYCLALRFPTVNDIVLMRRAYKNIDLNSTELIDKKHYDDIPFWFETDEDVDVEAVKNLLFRMYQVDEQFTNYTAMLFDFCKSDITLLGIVKALTLISGKTSCWNTSVGQKFAQLVLEDRKLHDELVKQRTLEIKQNFECATNIVLDLIDKTVHLCDSLILTDIDDYKEDWIDSEPVEEPKPVPPASRECEAGFEARRYPCYCYFLNISHVITLVNRTFNWRTETEKNISTYQVLNDIYKQCQSPMFNNQVLSHEFLNNEQFLKVFKTTKKFINVSPYKLVEKYLIETQLNEIET